MKLEPAQHHGNVLSAIARDEWEKEPRPFVARESGRRGVPIRIEGEWRRWRYDEAFAKLIPLKVATAPQLAQIVAE